jgi:WD40 repeat protein/serine/threonine protein kinase/pSer/pThr/pTyr-binding forkhead associated (FHA) protein
MANQSSVQWQAGDTILDLYRVIGSSSQGEFGEVYRVRHLGWNLDLAVHCPSPANLAAIGGRGAFEQAVNAWVNLEEHPHIAECYYLRRVGDTPLAFAEYGGGTLRQSIRNRWIYANGTIASLRRILDLAIQMAWGMQFIHEQGIIHRNLTPETVWVTQGGIAKITQIGLADPSIASRSPEQAEQDRLTPETDLWGWGLTVLELFAGSQTWTSGLLAAQALEDYLAGRVAAMVERPSMPAAIAQLLRRCFQINPADRPASFQAIAEQLQSIYQSATGSPYSRQIPARSELTADRLNNRALAFWDLGQPDDALRLWEQAIATQPHHLTSLYNRGLLRWRSGSSSDRELLDLIEANRPQPAPDLPIPDRSIADQSNGQTDYLLSLVHLERGDYETALRLLETVQAKGLYLDMLPPLLERLKQRLPESRRLVSDFSDRVTTFQRSINHRIVSLTVNPSGRFAVSGGEDQTIRLWDITTGRCMYTFRGHQGQVSAVAISPDGSQLVSGSQDKTVKLWSIAASTHLFTFGDDAAESQRRLGWMRQMFNKSQPSSSGNGHKGTVRSVALSADRRYLLSGGDDAAVKLWDALTGKCLHTLKEHKAPVFAVEFSANSRYALSASEDQTIKLWDIAIGQVLQTFQGHHQLMAAAYSPSGQFVLAGDTPIKLWNVSTGQVVQTFNDPGVRAVAFSADQRYLFSGGADRQLRLWELATGRCLHTFAPHESPIQAIAVSPDGRSVLSTDANSLKLWDVHSTTIDFAPLQVAVLPILQTAPVSTSDRRYEQAIAKAEIALSQNEMTTAAQHIRTARSQVGYQRGMEAVQAWLSLYPFLPRSVLQDSWQQASLEAHTASVRAIAISPDGESILSGSADQTIKRWDLPTERHLSALEGHTGAIVALAFNLEGTQALSGSADQTIRLWEVNTGKCLQTLVGHQGAVRAIAYHPKGRYAISGSDDHTLKLWDVPTGLCLRTLSRHSDRVTTVAISPDGQFLLSGSADKTMQLWQTATGEPIRSFSGHTAGLCTVAFSPDGQLALSSGDDQVLKLWTVATGDCLRSLTGHSATVRSLAFSPDGRYAASGGDDQSVKLWNIATGECVQTLTEHTATVRSVVFAADAAYLVSGSDDRTLKIWLLDWELLDRLPTDWDEAASPYIDQFLTLQTSSLAPLPNLRADQREPSSDAVTQALTPHGTPTWTESDFERLMDKLQQAGYGWLRPEGVRQQVISRTRVAAQTVSRSDINEFATAFGAEGGEFATAFGTDFLEAEPVAKVILTVTAGTLEGQEFVFSDRTVCIVGRARDCHLALPNDDNHKTVSRYHCLLDINPPAVRIRDLGSLHGTYLNGQMIGRRNRNQTPEEGMQINASGHDLTNGDEIKLGKTVFRITIEAPDQLTSLQPSAQSPAQPAAPEPTAFGDRFNLSPAVSSGSPSIPYSGSPSFSPGFSTHSDQKVLLPAIAGYTILHQLSSEEYTSTYLAYRTQTEERVMLKLIRPEKAVPHDKIDTFIQTVSPLKMLQHPHLVRLHEVGYFNGTFFFASDYWEGSSVATRVQQGKLPIAEAVAIALQALDGLIYAHQSGKNATGLIHGALSPETLILNLVSGGTIAKIADYGIATALKQAGFSGFADTAITQPAFMPRQQAIDFNYAQPDSDVWAIAACLYAMLTGTPPRSFSGKDPYLVLLQTDAVPIRQREAAIPQALAELIDLALVDNPALYFKNAVAFKQALASVAP